MQLSSRRAARSAGRGLVLAVGLATGAARSVAAQATDAASVSGVVVTANGARIAGATVRLRHLDRAGVWVELAGEDGRFRFERLPPGGPYELEAIAIGHRPARASGLTLELGRELRVEVRLGESAAVLSEIRVIGELAEPGGPTYLVPADAIRGLPLFNRSFVGLLQLVPHAVGRPGPSFGGQNSRYNSFRIDGTIANDLFGLGLTPGGEAGAPPISIEALAGVRIQVAPFDVRQGGFSGGAIEAVTRSGGNRLEVSAVGAAQRGDLIGRAPDGRAAPALDLLQWGLTVGGPIRRDRLHFFVAVDLQARDTTYQGPETGNPAVGVSEETARRIRAELIRRFGFDPGGAEPPVTRQPNGSAFAKLSWRPTAGHEVDLGYQRSFARSDGFDRENPTRGNGWMLSGSGYERKATIDALRLRARSTLGMARNELIAGFQSSRESRDSRIRAPLFLIQADVAGAYVAGGSFRNAQGTVLDQRQLELFDNLTVPLGRHELLVGGGVEAFHFLDNLLLLRWGSWTFGSVDSLERGVPSLYEIGLPPAPGAASPVADFSARTVAAYLQDRWTPARGVSISAGLRVEAPFVEAPTTNPALAGSPALRIDTGRFPSGGLRLSPRIALAWSLDRDERTVLRLGFGGFATRAPFVWLSNAFTNTGREQSLLTCGPATGVPEPTADLGALPSSCPGGSKPADAAPIVTLAPGLRLPSEQKLVVGVDRLLFGWSVSADLAVGWSRSGLTLVDRNLIAAGRSAEGRAMYGAIDGAGVASPARRDPGFGPVFQYQNVAGERSVAVSLVAARRWVKGGYVQVGYQWSRALERFAVNANSGPRSYQNVPIDGTMEERRPTRSTFDVPHSLTAVASGPVVAGVVATVVLSAQSGRPYAYVVRGDANADSVANNDLFYVPRDSSDVSLTDPAAWPALDRWIGSEPCVDRQRGRVMRRNSCRNPGFLTLDLRLARPFRIRGLGVVELSVDVFNLPNLLDGSFGLFRETTSREGLPLVALAGFDASANRPRYTVPAALPARGGVVSDLSRWRLQLGGRYRL